MQKYPITVTANDTPEEEDAGEEQEDTNPKRRNRRRNEFHALIGEIIYAGLAAEASMDVDIADFPTVNLCIEMGEHKNTDRVSKSDADYYALLLEAAECGDALEHTIYQSVILSVQIQIKWNQTKLVKLMRGQTDISGAKQ